MATRPVLSVQIAGPLPGPQEVAARLVSLCARLGLLDEACQGLEAPIDQANVGQMPCIEVEPAACPGKEVHSEMICLS